MNEVADRTEFRLRGQLVEAPSRGARVVEAAPGGDRADERRLFDEFEQVISVLVGRRALHEHRRTDSILIEQRREVGWFERAVDHRMLVRHPGLRNEGRIPEVVVGVDDHRASR